MPKVEEKTVQDYLKNIENVNNDQHKLVNRVYESIYNYVMYKEFLRTNNVDPATMMPEFSEVLLGIKGKLEGIVAEGEIELGTDKHSKFIKEFIFNPVTTLENETKRVDKMCNELGQTNNYELNQQLELLTYKNNLIKEENKKAKDKYNDLIKDKPNTWEERHNQNASWFINYFNNGNPILSEVLDRNKGGLFENLFKTTSNEYKEFSRRLANINNDGPDKGDLQGLRQSAFAYLDHKFKSDVFAHMGKNYSIMESEIDKLDPTSKGRVRLCLQTLESIDKAEEAVKDGLDPKSFVPKNDILIDDESLSEATFIGKKANDNYDELSEDNIIDQGYNDVLRFKNNILFQGKLKDDLEYDLNNDVEIDLNDNEISYNNLEK